MSMREKMLKSAIKGMATDFDDDLKRLSEQSKRENEPYIFRNDDVFPFITCYMCESADCEEIKFGNKKYHSIHVINLCKSCQKIMAKFLSE